MESRVLQYDSILRELYGAASFSAGSVMNISEKVTNHPPETVHSTSHKYAAYVRSLPSRFPAHSGGWLQSFPWHLLLTVGRSRLSLNWSRDAAGNVGMTELVVCGWMTPLPCSYPFRVVCSSLVGGCSEWTRCDNRCVWEKINCMFCFLNPKSNGSRWTGRDEECVCVYKG